MSIFSHGIHIKRVTFNIPTSQHYLHYGLGMIYECELCELGRVCKCSVLMQYQGLPVGGTLEQNDIRLCKQSALGNSCIECVAMASHDGNLVILFREMTNESTTEILHIALDYRYSSHSESLWLMLCFWQVSVKIMLLVLTLLS